MAVVDLHAMTPRELLLEYAAAYEKHERWGYERLNPENSVFGRELLTRLSGFDFVFREW